MFYNCKLIEFPNGSTQIRLYSDAIEYNYKEEDIKKDNKSVDKVTREYNPFTDEVEEFEEFNLDIKPNRNALNINRSYSRCIQSIYNYSRCYQWEYFITLTFNGDKIDRYDFDSCSKAVREWLKNIRNRYSKDIKYLVVPEQHKDGAWHFHGLLSDIGKLELIDSGHSFNGNTIFNIKQYKLGFSNVTKVIDTNKVSSYIGKYITKDLCSVTQNKHRYFVSNNIPKPIETLTCLQLNNCTYDEIIMRLADSLGKEIVFAKEIKGYVIRKSFIYDLQ